MSRFRILRVDHYDPVSIGRKDRLLYSVYGAIPSLIIFALNMAALTSKYHYIIFFISIIVLSLVIYFLLRKIRSDINNLKTIGEFEVTQSGLKKWLGDSLTEYNYHIVKELTLSKHMPSTRMKEGVNRYFSYILKIEFLDGSEESLVISDIPADHNAKLSFAVTMKTLKKIVPFPVNINT